MQASSVSRREHFWDGLRAFLMLLGIPYHVALAYQPHHDFIVHSGEGVPGFLEFSHVVHLFRMQAFFVIAGYFALLLLSRREPWEWLKGRFIRLGVPFLTVLVTIVPVMNLFCELSNMPLREALASLRHNSLSSGGYWVRHLWFIMALLYFCTAIAWLAARFQAVRVGMLPKHVDERAARYFLPVMLGIAAIVGLWEALALEAFYDAGLATMVPQQILRIDDVIIYAPWFALGCVLARCRQMLAKVQSFSAVMAVVAVGAIALWLTVHSDVAPMTERFIGAFAALATTQVLIALAYRLLDRPVPVIRKLTDASFVIYLFHLPLIAVLVWLGQPLGLPPLVKALAVTLLSFGISYVIWQGVARVRSMAFLFDGIILPTGRATAA